MRNSKATLIVVTLTRFIRTELDEPTRECRVEPRSPGASLGESVQTALKGESASSVWILSDEVFAQEVTLNPSQIAGLSREELSQALSFEVEPFSGISVAESAVGFHDKGGGRFSVVAMPRSDRSAIENALAYAGGKLTGIAHASAVPEDAEALREWISSCATRISHADIPFIPPTSRVPSPHRFLAFGIALEAAAVLFLLATAGWRSIERKDLDRRQAELTAPSNELNAANRRINELKAELAALGKDQAMRERVLARRGALHSMLHGLAATRPEDVVIRKIEAEGPSSIIVSGLSLEASAVDELSIVLTRSLRDAGWAAEPRHKTGKDKLRNGGPWEFSLTLTHQEAGRSRAVALNKENAE